MDREALRQALVTTGRTLAISTAGGLALAAAIYLPTYALIWFAGWPFLDAYLMGCPIGIIIVTLAALGIMTYRQKASRS